MSDALAATIATAIKAERYRAGLSQLELGERLGWSKSMVSKTERGERAVLAAELPEICAALGVTLDRLLQDADREDMERLGL